jgi:hypothetical protein
MPAIAHKSNYCETCCTRNVLFLIALAKYQGVSGSGHAKAFVREFCARRSSDQVLCGVEDNPDLATSAGIIENCQSMTFEVEVNSAFGYGVWIVHYLEAPSIGE